MPIYEYQCTACGHQIEALQTMKEKALTECPSCHKATLQRLVSAGGFQLKGTGWYATDFRNKKPAEKESTETKKEDNKTDAQSTTKSDKAASSS